MKKSSTIILLSGFIVLLYFTSVIGYFDNESKGLIDLFWLIVNVKIIVIGMFGLVRFYRSQDIKLLKRFSQFIILLGIVMASAGFFLGLDFESILIYAIRPIGAIILYALIRNEQRKFEVSKDLPS